MLTQNRKIALVFMVVFDLFGSLTQSNGQQFKADHLGEVPSLSQRDDHAIREILKNQETAWNQHDMTSFTKDFRDDAEGVNVAAMHWKGKPALLKHLTDFHATFLKHVQEYLEDVQVRAISDDCAIAVNIWKVDGFRGPTGIEIPESRHLSTVVFSRSTDGWKIVHFHNTTVDERAIKAASDSKDK